MKKANSAIALLTIVLAAITAACSNSGCIGNGSSIPLAAFYDYATGRQGSMEGVTVKGVGAPGDSLLADKSKDDSDGDSSSSVIDLDAYLSGS